MGINASRIPMESSQEDLHPQPIMLSTAEEDDDGDDKHCITPGRHPAMIAPTEELPPTTPSLMDLPPELRNMIYTYLLTSVYTKDAKLTSNPLFIHAFRGGGRSYRLQTQARAWDRLNILLVSRQIFTEASSVLYERGTFRLYMGYHDRLTSPLSVDIANRIQNLEIFWGRRDGGACVAPGMMGIRLRLQTAGMQDWKNLFRVLKSESPRHRCGVSILEGSTFDWQNVMSTMKAFRTAQIAALIAPREFMPDTTYIKRYGTYRPLCRAHVDTLEPVLGSAICSHPGGNITVHLFRPRQYQALCTTIAVAPAQLEIDVGLRIEALKEEGEYSHETDICEVCAPRYSIAIVLTYAETAYIGCSKPHRLITQRVSLLWYKTSGN